MKPVLAQLLAVDLSTLGIGAAVTVGILLVVFVSLAVWASRYTKVGPNEVLIISGRRYRVTDPSGQVIDRGFRVVKGGGTFVMPVVEKVDILSLELLTIDVNTPRSTRAKASR